MDTGTSSMTSRPFIQVDDEVREMTEEEYAHHLSMTGEPTPLMVQLAGLEDAN